MVIEIIDLTCSPPPPLLEKTVDDIAVDVSNITERDKAKKKRKKARKTRRETRDEEAPWQHDKYEEMGSPREERIRDQDSGTQPKRLRSPVFMVDTVPGDVAGGLITAPLGADAVDVEAPSLLQSNSVKSGLLLPVHVTLAQEESQSIPDDNPPLSPISEASGIDFLDDDRAVGASRYFDNRTTANHGVREPCKRCGDYDHDFRQCTTLICLTCGARDEHVSRSCPILRCCFNCKEKGHIARNCPNIVERDSQLLGRNDCERCGSWNHHGTNCPTIWRIYTYLTDTERDEVLAQRESKRLLGFDNGGEGYIARDAWCYNCGNSGHLGDDCTVAPANHDRPDDYSAFGSYNQSTGPFASMLPAAPDIKRVPREWEMDDRFDDGYGFSAHTNVGRKARENAKARAREAQRLMDDADDEPDWFEKNQVPSKSKLPQSQPKERADLPFKPTTPTIRLGFHQLKPARAPWDPSDGQPPTSRPSLRDRIDMEHGQDPDRSRSDREKRNIEPQRHHGQKRREREQGLEAEERNQRDGRRWRGGYER